MAATVSANCRFGLAAEKAGVARIHRGWEPENPHGAA